MTTVFLLSNQVILAALPNRAHSPPIDCRQPRSEAGEYFAKMTAYSPVSQFSFIEF